MNKKSKNIVLLVLAALIWIIAGIQLYNALGTENDVTSVYRTLPPAPNEGKIEEIKYELQLSYDDPFLIKKRTINKGPSLKKKPSPVVSQIKKNNSVSWGKIIYYGMFSNNSTLKQMGSGSFQGFTTTFNEGDTIRGIKIIKIYPDSVQLLKEGELKYFYK